MTAWDVEECEDAKLAAELVSLACLKSRISRRRKNPLILYIDNGNALTAGFRAAIARGNPLRCYYKIWVCSDSFPARRPPTTTRTRNPLSVRSNTVPSTPASLLPKRPRPANGFHLLWIVKTTNTAIAASNLLRLSKGIAVRLLRSAASGHAFMS